MKNLLQKALVAIGVLGVGYLVFKPKEGAGAQSPPPSSTGPGAPPPNAGFKPPGSPHPADAHWTAKVGDHLLLEAVSTREQNGAQVLSAFANLLSRDGANVVSNVIVRVTNIMVAPVGGTLAMGVVDDSRFPFASANPQELPVPNQLVTGIWPA